MTILVEQSQKHTLMLLPAAKSLDLTALHFDPDFLTKQALITKTAQGRGTVYFFALGNSELVLRHYKRGGLIARVSTDKFLFKNLKSTRCYEELNILQHLVGENVNVPIPIAGRICKSGLTYTADIITKVIDNSFELDFLLTNGPLPKATWQAIGAQLKKMHNAQVFHGDINVKNILVAQGENQEQVYILDFDKCSIMPGSNWKPANLARFQRSLVKHKTKQSSQSSEQKNTYHYQHSDWEELLKAYKK
jgi:3-deoxy-D-manno-octulosonic acid kinase